MPGCLFGATARRAGLPSYTRSHTCPSHSLSHLPPHHPGEASQLSAQLSAADERETSLRAELDSVHAGLRTAHEELGAAFASADAAAAAHARVHAAR
eukprot:353395-Chlamydomonas_euryale.AAC.4